MSVKADDLLEELWTFKDRLAAESGYDAEAFFENLRRWEAEQPLAGGIVRGADALRRLAADAERARAEAPDMALRERPEGQT